MKAAIHRGLEAEGVLPGPLNLRRKAYLLYTCYRIQTVPSIERTRILLCTGGKRGERFGGKDSNCPHLWFLRCHALPYFYHLQRAVILAICVFLRALATAGLIGNIVKFNASISGAEVGCQGEVGVACAMASAAANQLFGGSPAQIQYAAEMGLNITWV